MNKLPNWKVFIVTHGPVVDKYYQNDPLFTTDHYEFFNVSDNVLTHSTYNVLNKKEIENFIHLGKWYAESEVIYNIYKTGIYRQLDYIGFIHWDYELRSPEAAIGYQVTSAIYSAMQRKTPFISFSSYNFDDIYKQNIMMDQRYPNHKIGNGKNCFDTIVTEYNSFFGKNLSINDFRSSRINLCSAFLCRSDVFDDLMGFYSHIIEKREIEKYDTDHKYRFQGGILERYIGLYTALINFEEIELIHHYYHAKELSKGQFIMARVNSFKYRMKQFLFNLIMKK